MSRFSSIADKARGESRKLAGIFLTNGFPDLKATLELLHVIDDAGADFIELGMPFSDPLAEGLPIQHSSSRALAQGVKMRDAFTTVEHFRRQSETPVYLMGYVNPIMAYGVSNFCRDAYSCGVDGLILPDLPPGSDSVGIEAAAGEVGLDMVFLIAPNASDERIRRVDEASTGFVYAVSVAGLTGTALGAHESVNAYLQRAKHLVTRNPLLVGFGIRDAADAQELSLHTDGFIVGSALVRVIDDLWNDASLTNSQRMEGVASFVSELTGRLPASA
jgi:tryptophan synthase alpha chain